MHLVIIGNGISGITTARFVRKLSDHRITVISAESDHFFSRTALMYIYMGHLRYQDTKPYEDHFWAKNRIELLRDRVAAVDTAAQTLALASGSNLPYDKLVIATGSVSNKFGWRGQDLNAVGGLYHLQDLENMERYSAGLERAVIVGGGLIGIEMAEMFRSRNVAVTMLVRETSYWNNVLPAEESAMVNRHIREHHIDLRLASELREILPNDKGRARAVVTGAGEEIACGYVGLTAGVSPNIAFLKGSGIETQRGVLVDDLLQTSAPNVYAAGDCVQLRQPQPTRRPIEAVWYTGKMMGETLAYTLCGQPTQYVPRLWFNSAKFLDIEYQVYGDVRPDLPAQQRALYWEHKDGKKSVRIVYQADNQVVVGFNLMGIRYRHEVCERWIQQKATLETVLANLSLANFDPEFFRTYERDLFTLYTQQTGRTIVPKRQKGLNAVLQFMKN